MKTTKQLLCASCLLWMAATARAQPTITDFHPKSGRVGDVITITGTNLFEYSTTTTGENTYTHLNSIGFGGTYISITDGDGSVIRVKYGYSDLIEGNDNATQIKVRVSTEARTGKLVFEYSRRGVTKFAFSSEDFTVIDDAGGGGGGNPPPTTTDPRITALETSQRTQDIKITALETSRASLETSQGTQDGEITSLETSQSAQDTKITALETSRASLETSQGTQDGEITALETSQRTQDTKITALEDELAALEAKISAFEAALAAAGIDLPDTGGGGAGGTATTIYNVPAASANARVYPNPASHTLLFANLASGRVYVYKIYTPSGTFLSSGVVQNDERVDVSTLAEGQYILTLQDDAHEVLRTSLLVEGKP